MWIRTADAFSYKLTENHKRELLSIALDHLILHVDYPEICCSQIPPSVTFESDKPVVTQRTFPEKLKIGIIWNMLRVSVCLS